MWRVGLPLYALPCRLLMGHHGALRPVPLGLAREGLGDDIFYDAAQKAL